MTRWLLWEDVEARPGAENMALDLALMEDAATTGSAYLRLYRWQPFCLSFGCHEPALRRYDRAAIEARGIDVVRRPTGGRAVWHARELTYSVATPDGLLGSLQQAYLHIHAALARAVQAFGVRATLAPPARPAALSAGACFASAAGGEVVVDGAKLLGSAQLRRGGGMLQHGSLLLADDQCLVAELSGESAATGTTLHVAAGRAISWDEAAGAIREHAAPALAPTWGVLQYIEPIARAARQHEHFADPAWSWRR